MAGCLIGLTQTGGIGFVLWQVTLSVMLLRAGAGLGPGDLAFRAVSRP